jgi:hypothetical protein
VLPPPVPLIVIVAPVAEPLVKLHAAFAAAVAPSIKTIATQMR